jgi:hypothetical protein
MTQDTMTQDMTQGLRAPIPLTGFDRCDRCGAQAYVRVELPVGELLFCGHHAHEHAPKYTGVATRIQDERNRLMVEHAGR